MKLPFKTHSKHAAKEERERHYQHASKLWRKLQNSHVEN